MRRRGADCLVVVLKRGNARGAVVPYVGVAAAINGVVACREVFAAADKK